jgi:peptidyl-prolyl cis-trans isomerase C
MKTVKMKPLLLVALCILVWGGSAAWAQSPAAKTPLAAGTLLSVNGVAITESAVNRVLSDLQTQGTAVTAQLREQVIGEMVVRQVMISEASKRGLDKTPVFTQQLEELRMRLLVDTLLSDNLTKTPISEQDEHAEYARQKKVLGDGDTTPQYFLSQVVLKTEQQARDVISLAKSGSAFEKLAIDSVDEAGKANGGKVGWVLPTDVLPAIGTVIVNLSKGMVAAAPIQSPAGWHVIKVDDVRPFKIPSFEEARPQIRQALLVQRRQAFVEGLLKGANIQRP